MWKQFIGYLMRNNARITTKNSEKIKENTEQCWLRTPFMKQMMEDIEITTNENRKTKSHE